jgi:hypothetical protein
VVREAARLVLAGHRGPAKQDAVVGSRVVRKAATSGRADRQGPGDRAQRRCRGMNLMTGPFEQEDLTVPGGIGEE